MTLLNKKCPKCKSHKIRFHRRYPTKNHGTRTIYKCEDCFKHFSETKNTFLENLKKPISLIWQVIKARTEGMGVNATTRTLALVQFDAKYRANKNNMLFTFNKKIKPLGIA